MPRALLLVALAFLPLLRAAPGYVETGELKSPHATQAAAADARHVYAISSTKVAKYDRATGKLLGISTGEARHLNSGFLHGGKLYCAHSNYPKKPDESDVRVLDPATMKLSIHHAFKEPPGSLTWVVRAGGHWWCAFAHYHADNARTMLVKMDDGWRERGRWKFPKAVVADWGKMSCSGGTWHGGGWLTTGHDKKVLYRLRLPAEGDTLELVEALASPFPGQGIAADPKTGGLVGIDRAGRRVVFAAAEDGWVDLFPADGPPKGWKVTAWNDLSKPGPKDAVWTVKDGTLRTGKQRGSWLVSEKAYGDFILTFEIKLEKLGNSGVALRAPLKGDPAFAGLELQVADLRYNTAAKADELTGAIYRAIAPKKQVYKPEEWNDVRIELKGDKLKVAVNGEPVIDTDLSKHDKKVKTHDPKVDAPPLKDRPRKGHIGFQHLSRDSSPVTVRKARIKELK